MSIQRAPKGEQPNLAIDPSVSIEVDPTVGPDQIQEGLAREVMRKIQAARKNADFQLDDRISLELHCADASVKSAVEAHLDLLKSETLTEKFAFADSPKGRHVEEAEVEMEVPNPKIRIGVTPV